MCGSAGIGTHRTECDNTSDTSNRASADGNRRTAGRKPVNCRRAGRHNAVLREGATDLAAPWTELLRGIRSKCRRRLHIYYLQHDLQLTRAACGPVQINLESGGSDALWQWFCAAVLMSARIKSNAGRILLYHLYVVVLYPMNR